MQILAVEQFTEEKYANKAQDYLKHNDPYISKLHEKGYVQAYWSRGDRPGTVLLLETESLVSAKKILMLLPLVKKQIVTYSLLPLEPYQVQQMLPEKKEFLTLVYVSEASEPMDYDKLNKILKTSRSKNEKVGITGVLLYENGSFLQVLEGKEKPVHALYKKICNDERHRHIAKITEIRSFEKTFAEWSMGYADISTEELESIEGMNDFFKNDNCFIDLKHEQVERLLKAFKEGRYRQRIE